MYMTSIFFHRLLPGTVVLASFALAGSVVAWRALHHDIARDDFGRPVFPFWLPLTAGLTPVVVLALWVLWLIHLTRMGSLRW